MLTQKLNRSDRKRFANAIQKINEYLEQIFDSRGKRSIAFFANDTLFEILEFEFPLLPLIKFSNAAYLDPILAQIFDHNRYLVLLVDRKKARMFTVNLGEIEEYKDFIVDAVPQEVKVEEEHFYGRSNKISRHIEDHLNRHLKIVTEKLKEFIDGERINFILLGGHEDLFERVKKQLPKYLRDKVVGEFPFELNVPLNEILLASKKVAEHIVWENEYEQMERVLSGAS
jgi:peptide chain release factor subunit 1